jgi:hypothetical protein
MTWHLVISVSSTSVRVNRMPEEFRNQAKSLIQRIRTSREEKRTAKLKEERERDGFYSTFNTQVRTAIEEHLRDLQTLVERRQSEFTFGYIGNHEWHQVEITGITEEARRNSATVRFAAQFPERVILVQAKEGDQYVTRFGRPIDEFTPELIGDELLRCLSEVGELAD